MSAPAAVRPAVRTTASRLPLAILALAWLTAFSARTNTIAVGPVLPLLQTDLHMTFAEGGLLFALPMLMMGLFAIPGGLILARLGVKPILIGSLVLLGAGGLLRATANSAASLFVYTAIAGAGIGLVQPALPRLIKDWFADRAGVYTGVYSSGFPMGAIVGATLAVPLAVGLHWGWRGQFVLWSVLVWLTLVAWFFVPHRQAHVVASLAPFKRIFTNRLCWIASGLFLTQSTVYYVLNASLASYYQSFGWSLDRAASSIAFLSAGSLIGGLVAPIASDKTGRRPLLLANAGLAVVSMIGLIAWPQEGLWLWPSLLGLATAALFTIGLIIPVDVASAEEVGAFSGLMLAVGYSGVMVGPPLVGLLRDLSGTYLYGMLALLAVTMVELWLALILPETAPRHKA